MKEKEKHIYIAGSSLTPYIMIASSVDPITRIKTLSRAAGAPLEILFQTSLLNNAEQIEKMVQERFESKRRFSKWFEVDFKEVRHFIDTMEGRYYGAAEIKLPHTEINIKSIEQIDKLPQTERTIYNNKIAVQDYKTPELGKHSIYYIKYRYAGFNIYLKFIYEGEAIRYVDKLKQFIVPFV